MKPIWGLVSTCSARTGRGTHLVRDVEGIVVCGEADVCLFLAVGADEGVDLGGLHVVELFDSVLGGFGSAKPGQMNARRTLIWRLLDLMSTMKTRVLCSSIFFIADSVFRGLAACY
jgi:hypothetical protein